MNVCLVTTPLDSTLVLPVKFGQPLCLMSPIGRKALGVELDSTPPCTFACCPHLLFIPCRLCHVLSIPSTFDLPTPASYLGFCSWRGRSARYCIVPDEPYRAKGAGSEVGLHPTLHIRCCPHLLIIPRRLCSVFSIPSTFDPPTPASYLSFRSQQGRSAQYCVDRGQVSAV